MIKKILLLMLLCSSCHANVVFNKCDTDILYPIFRTEIPTGWLVYLGGKLTFVQDEKHKWVCK